MRPLTSIKPDTTAFDHPVDALLMMSMGECCAMCERPLIAESLVWDRDNAQLVQGKTDSDHWDAMLLLCHNCGQEAQNSKKQNISREALVYPDRQITFGLKKESLFQYVLEEVEQVTFDENNQAIGETVSKKVVLIKGMSESAQRTIDFFKLNSHYYDQKKNTLLVPMHEDHHQLDRRLDLRTQAWQRADSFVQLFKQTENKEFRAALTTNLRNSISHSGFWSIGVTVFWQAFQDKELMRTLFAQEEKPVVQDRLLKAKVINLGQGPHHHFPGTNDGWLD